MSFHLTMPKIAIEKALNGYVVVYSRQTTAEERKRSSEKTMQVVEVATTEAELLRVIGDACAFGGFAEAVQS